MRQVFQSLDSGETAVVEVPAPGARRGHLLLGTRASLISAGTERMLVEFGKANPIAKVRQQPERARQVLDKVRTDGLQTTLTAVRSKLAQPLPLGYCNAGVVLEVGEGVAGYRKGDRVASNGPHAEVVSVPPNLCAPIPNDVTDEAAAFTPLAAIALQGVRLAAPTLGERFVVTGLGLVGLLAVQLLRANGCAVLGIDLDPAKVELARELGAEGVDLSRGDDPGAAAQSFAAAGGVDGVLIAASTKSNDPVRQAAEMCRQRGRIVLVGVTGLELDRQAFYEKELTFQVSCSYGPGRYDPTYEEAGTDYPAGFVRWTEQRNFTAVLDLLAHARIDAERLISHRYPLEEAQAAYETVTSDRTALGVVLGYSSRSQPGGRPERRIILHPVTVQPAGQAVVAVIGAGNYTSQVLLPALARTGARLHTIVSSGGASAANAGRRFGFAHASTDSSAAMTDPAINTVFVATRHDSHAEFTVQALRQGKHVYVEKPLAIAREQLDAVAAVYREIATGGSPPLLMVGFNRRFAPHVVRMHGLLSRSQLPKTFVMTINAGALPADHWTLDPIAGGNRLIGEACHFVDLLRHLAGEPITSVRSVRPGGGLPGGADGATISLEFAGGSIGTVHYVTTGHRAHPKERLEVFCGGRSLVLDNFRRLTGRGWKDLKRMTLRTQDKGHTASVAHFIRSVEAGGPPGISLEEMIEIHTACFDAAEWAP